MKNNAIAGLSLKIIFEVGEIDKIAGNSSCCSEVNVVILYQNSQGYISKYEGKSPGPGHWPLMTALHW